MTSKPRLTVTILSDNTLTFDFPYQGVQRGQLMLRRHPKWGNDVIISIERGQILCHSYGDCDVSVRFDDDPIINYQGTEPSDNSSEYVFLPAFSKFHTRLKTAKRVRVQFNVYQQGMVFLDFNVKGYEPLRLD